MQPLNLGARAARRRGSRLIIGVLLALLSGLGALGCGGSAPTSGSTRTAQSTGSKSQAPPARLPVKLRTRPLFSLPAPVQDPASAPTGPGRFVLLGGLNAADTSSAAVVGADLRGARPLGQLPNAQHDAQAAILARRVYVFGGGQYSEYDHILQVDPRTGAVSNAGRLPQPSSDAAVAAVGHSAYIVGGYDGTHWLDTILAWQPGAQARVVAHLPVGLRYAAVSAVGQDLLIAGGTTPSGISDAVLRFDTRTGAVTRLARLPQALTHAGAGTLNGLAYVVGGRAGTASAPSDRIWAVNPSSGALHAAGRLAGPLSDMAVISMGDRIVVAGGHSPGGTVAAVSQLLP